jgi:hypothetical protein
MHLESKKVELVKKSFYDKLSQISERIPPHDTKIIVDDFNAKTGTEKVFKPVTRKWRLYDIK